MLRRLITFLLGHLRIEVRGGQPERFLNLALEAGLYLWGIQRQPDRMVASLTVGDFRLLRPIARGSRCRIYIVRRHGLPFRLARLRSRPALIAGAIACTAFILWASSHIWVVRVKVTGPQYLDPRAVAAVAAQAGLTRGAAKGRIESGEIEQAILKHMAEVSWAVVRIQGTRAVIEVVEKAARAPIRQGECVHLYARKAGVVEQVVPFQGEAMVKQGDVVQPGTLLVECAFRYYADGRPLVVPGTEVPRRESVARTEMAYARVRALVPYQQYHEVPLVREVKSKTGRVATRWVLKVGNRTILLRGDSQVPYAHYEEHRQAYALGPWRNWKSPVELVTLNAEELEVHSKRTTPQAAVAEWKARTEAWLAWVLGPTDRVVAPVTVEVVHESRDRVGLRVTAHTLEEISVPTAAGQ